MEDAMKFLEAQFAKVEKKKKWVKKEESKEKEKKSPFDAAKEL